VRPSESTLRSFFTSGENLSDGSFALSESSLAR
jgi:hypothetical protein